MPVIISKQTLRRHLAAGALALACLCGGCAVGGFRQPQETPPENNVAPAETESGAPIQVYQARELLYEKKLSLPSGAQAAIYRVALPQFEEEGDKAPILEKINQHYRAELSVLQQDCESYFNQIKAHYGESWQSAQQPELEYRVDFDYQIRQAAGQRISLSRTYRYLDVAGKEKTVYSAETFDCTTGWLIKLGDLFADKEQAEEEVKRQIQLWIDKNQIENISAEDFSFEKQDSAFAIGEDTLYLCLDESVVSTESAGGCLAEIPLESLEDWMVQPAEEE